MQATGQGWLESDPPTGLVWRQLKQMVCDVVNKHSKKNK